MCSLLGSQKSLRETEGRERLRSGKVVLDVVLGVFSIKCSSDVMFHGFAAQVCELWPVSGLCLGDVSLK